MKKLLLIVAISLSVGTAYAKPNYAGDYTGVFTWQVNESDSGRNLAKEGEPFALWVSHKKRKIRGTDIANSDFQGRKFKKIPTGFEFADSWQVLEGGYESYCTTQEIIRITNVKKKSATLFYSHRDDCTDGTFYHFESTIPLTRKK